MGCRGGGGGGVVDACSSCRGRQAKKGGEGAGDEALHNANGGWVRRGVGEGQGREGGGAEVKVGSAH